LFFPCSSVQQKTRFRICMLDCFSLIIVLPNRASTRIAENLRIIVPASTASKNTLGLCFKNICHKFEMIMKY
jgi:hypothetical protein